MRDDITRLTYQQIEKNWSKKIKKEYEGLNSAKNIIEFLKSSQYMITFRYALCRFIRERYGERSKEDPKVSIVRYADFCVQFSNEAGTPFAWEVEDYLVIMKKLIEDRGMTGEIQVKLLRRYLLGKQENVSRDTLFKMAFAFDMDCEYVCELLEVIGEIPYNFRRPEECIYYFCQYSEEHNHWQTARSLIDWYYSEESFSAGMEADQRMKIQAGQSRMMEEHISVILDRIEDHEEQKKALMDHLDIHRPEMQGYSLSAYQIFEELLEELKEFLNAKDDTELSIRLWEPIWIQYYTKKADKTGVNRSDFVPWKNLLELPKTVYEKPLWRARIQKLRKRQVPVEKRDILFLSCMRWTLEQETEGGIDAVQEFLMETNELLLESGLSVIYPPNPYDRMILLAICSDSPYEILSDIFYAATDQKKLQEQLEK